MNLFDPFKLRKPESKSKFWNNNYSQWSIASREKMQIVLFHQFSSLLQGSQVLAVWKNKILQFSVGEVWIFIDAPPSLLHWILYTRTLAFLALMLTFDPIFSVEHVEGHHQSGVRPVGGVQYMLLILDRYNWWQCVTLSLFYFLNFSDCVLFYFRVNILTSILCFHFYKVKPQKQKTNKFKNTVCKVVLLKQKLISSVFPFC